MTAARNRMADMAQPRRGGSPGNRTQRLPAYAVAKAAATTPGQAESRPAPDLLLGRRPPPPPAEQVNVRADLGERVARRVDAIDARDGVEDDLSPLRLLVIDAGGQGERTEGDLYAAVRPGQA